ncbi:hypothetical protein BGZ82_007339 [Podila clonocystis]|nr:hypothetical protein BGZ82_007339 [Podila clonocystis]
MSQVLKPGRDVDSYCSSTTVFHHSAHSLQSTKTQHGPINNTRILRAQYASNHVLTVDNFKQDTVQLDTALQAGEIFVRTLYLSLDPITRLSFNDPHAKVSTLKVITGFGLGEMIESKDPDFPRSAIAGLSVIEDARNPKILVYAYLNVLGITGLTAWAAVDTIVKKFKKDQVVNISSAAGPVGTFFAILAKCEGTFVVGSAGLDDKVQYLLENIGLDAGFNYKTQDARDELAKAAPQGLDITSTSWATRRWTLRWKRSRTAG